MPPVREFWSLFLKVGNLTFGGGDPTMAALKRELVERRSWLSREDYALVFTLARVIPGTNLLAFCAGVGWLLLRWRGAVLSVLAVTVPSAIVVIWLTIGYEIGKGLPLLMATIGGTIAAAIGMMFAAAWQLLAPHLTRDYALRAIVLFLGSVLLGWKAQLNPVAVLALAAVVGFCWRPRERS